MTTKEVAVIAARKAGELLKQKLGTVSSLDIADKNPFDFVTVIDKEAEQLIIDVIQKYFPHHGILAEESGDSQHKHSSRWIIDPLDGTTNFIHGYPHNGISIALEEDNEIVLGVVYDPHRDELFYAEKGKGAYLNDQPIRVSKRNKLRHCLVATGFPFKDRDVLAQYWDVLSEIFMQVSGIRRTGSAALDLAYIGCGRFDGFWELRLSPWDIAAGSIIVKEAGGEITDCEGKTNHIWSGNVVASNNLIHDFILRSIAEVFPDLG